MNALVYKNTKTNLPGWVDTVHQDQPRGYAYELDGYFVHIYGRGSDLWAISIGLTASEGTNGSLEEWVKRVFGAEDIRQSKYEVGEVIPGVWRPGLYFQEEIFQALSTSEHEQRSDEQSLRVLIDKLDDLLLYIEPSPNGLKTYSHKTRELLILACTEVENLWNRYMMLANAVPARTNFTTNDYVKLCEPLYLPEYEVSLRSYKAIQPIRPFVNWNQSQPTQSLGWCDAYNKTKHDRERYFSEATLQNCIEAIAAAIIMFCVRYSPYPLIQGLSSLSAAFNQLFSVRLVDCDPASFYIPKIKFDNKRVKDLVCGDAKGSVEPWLSNPLVL